MINATFKQLVGGDQGLLDRRIFAADDIYKQELEQIYGRCWLYLGHECQVVKPNDFTSMYMGEDPVLLTRDGKGKLHAFLNMCRHRGNRICRADAGNAPSFMCTYHGWTFSTDGKLVGVPGYKEAYFEELDRSQWGLVEVAQIDSYKGLIFGTWDSRAPALIDYLGDQAWELDMTVDRRAGGAELIVGPQNWGIPPNWKFPGDNLAGHRYHVPVAHGSAIKMGFGGAGRPDTAGAAAAVNKVSNSSVEINNYYKQNTAELEQRLGPERAKILSGSILTVFPNLSLNFGRQLLHIWHPRGPLKTEIWGNCLLDKAAPDEVKKTAMRWYTQTFGPSGFLEQDDMNNWLGGTDTSKSRVAQRFPMNLQMGLGHENEDAGASMYSGRPAEKRQRAFYIRWAEMMDAPSWSTVDLKRKYSRW